MKIKYLSCIFAFALMLTLSSKQASAQASGAVSINPTTCPAGTGNVSVFVVWGTNSSTPGPNTALIEREDVGFGQTISILQPGNSTGLSLSLARGHSYQFIVFDQVASDGSGGSALQVNGQTVLVTLNLNC
ncbi:MAG TPA: hypothetical protein VKZ53_01070 [Candidatus Angelobacter sp.]|nr:hypothetical protein [Candidatus Angelobacter sp.]